MNEATEKRLALARRNAIAYLATSKVKAIGVAGSVARGQANAYSDVDMSIYYDELPTTD